jgi:hypothetical protein
MVHLKPTTPLRQLSAIASIALAISGQSGTVLASSQHPARTARALNATDTAHLHYIRENADSTLIEEGTAKGGLPGKVKAHMSVEAKVAATFTITTRFGSLTGHGSGILHSSGEYASFGGSMTVTSGTGRYAHAHGHGGFYGTINRSTYATTVQTTGTLSY